MTTAIHPAPRKIKQTFSLHAPGAKHVALAGDFTGWEQHPLHLKHIGHDVWRVAVKLEPGQYQYRFMVDGKWQDDPASTLRVPNSFGDFNTLLRVK